MGIDARAAGLHGNGEPLKPTTSAAELSQIAVDIEAFLGLWMGRIEGLLNNRGGSSMGETDLQERIANFEVAQRHWNDVRRQEVQQIQETTEQLSAAWDRLEDERRRVLQAQETSPQRAPERGPAGLATRDAVPTRATPVRTTEPHRAGGLDSEVEASDARDRAVRQFEKLKRHMGIPTP